MMATRAFAISMRGLLGVAACAVSSAAIAQSYSANGQISYLQEWEMKGSLAKTMTRTGTNYDGPVTLRHVGLCSTNGIEEKSGVVQLRIPPTNAGFVGTLALKDDNCIRRTTLYGPAQLPRRPRHPDPLYHRARNFRAHAGHRSGRNPGGK